VKSLRDRYICVDADVGTGGRKTVWVEYAGDILEIESRQAQRERQANSVGNLSLAIFINLCFANGPAERRSHNEPATLVVDLVPACPEERGLGPVNRRFEWLCLLGHHWWRQAAQCQNKQ